MKMNLLNRTANVRRLAAATLLASFVFSNAFAVYAFDGTVQRYVLRSEAAAKYTTDLTELGRQGRLRENTSYDAEAARLVKVLAEGGIRQPVIVDEDKGVQNAIVEQVAIRIAKGQAPPLVGRQIIKLETENLFSNVASKEDASKIIASIIDDAVASKGQVILFADELTNLAGFKAVSSKVFERLAAATGPL